MNTANGMNVGCPRCNQRFNVYEDINQNKNGRLIAMCPKCNEVTGYDFEHPFSYSVGNVPPHIHGEDVYDWEWGSYKEDIEPEENSFDQDGDLIHENLGFCE